MKTLWYTNVYMRTPMSPTVLFFVLLVLIGSTLVAPVFVSAHGEEEGGTQGLGGFGQTINDYFIDIEYGEENIVEDIPAPLSFKIVNKYTGAAVPLTNIRVTITEGSTLVFSTNLSEKVNTKEIGMFFPFPHEGNYTLTATFQRGSETIVETSIPIFVRGEPFPISPWSTLFLGVGAGAGALVLKITQQYESYYSFLQRTRKHKKKKR